MSDIKLLISVCGGEVITLSIPMQMWVNDTYNAHWEIHQLINEAMIRIQQDEIEEYDYYRWVEGPWMEDDDEVEEYDEEGDWRESA